MTKKFITTVIITALTAGSLFAYGSNDESYHEKGEYYKNFKYKKSGCSHFKKSYFHKKGHFKKESFDISKMFKGLNLTKEQRFKISIISDEMKLEIKKVLGYSHDKIGSIKKYLGENGFDKTAYLKDKKEKLEKLLEIRANGMEKIFKVLTPEQIKQFKERKRDYKKYNKYKKGCRK